MIFIGVSCSTTRRGSLWPTRNSRVAYLHFHTPFHFQELSPRVRFENIPSALNWT